MAQTGYTPILIYSSSTAAAAPVAGSLTNSTLGSELAINITDGKLFYKDNANAIQVIGWKVVPTTAGGTGLTSYAQGDLLYYNSGTTLTALAKNTTATRYLSNTGTNNNPAWAQIDLTNGVTDRLPYANLAQGSALSVLGVTGNATADVASIAAGTDNQVLRRSGTSVGFGAIALNQSAAVTGTLPTGNGGTGLASFTANGIVYASSTIALATGSALTFDGTNFSTTGSATATRFIPTGSTVPTNGMYLPAANTVGIATNSTEDIRFFSTGGISIGDTTDPGAGNLRLGTGNLVIGTSGKGIDFSADPSPAGMTSELLDDYEEGTWTPIFTTSNVGFGTITYSASRSGWYLKVGNLVTCSFEIRTDTFAVGSASGTVGIGGLPFTSNFDGGGTVTNAVQLMAGDYPSTLQTSGGTIAFLYYRTAANGVTIGLDPSDMQTGTNANANFLRGVFVYRTN